MAQLGEEESDLVFSSGVAEGHWEGRCLIFWAFWDSGTRHYLNQKFWIFLSLQTTTSNNSYYLLSICRVPGPEC